MYLYLRYKLRYFALSYRYAIQFFSNTLQHVTINRAVSWQKVIILKFIFICPSSRLMYIIYAVWSFPFKFGKVCLYSSNMYYHLLPLSNIVTLANYRALIVLKVFSIGYMNLEAMWGVMIIMCRSRKRGHDRITATSLIELAARLLKPRCTVGAGSLWLQYMFEETFSLLFDIHAVA